MACFSRSLTATESAWSTFERELYAFHESLASVDHLVKGYPLVCLMDHKNNLFTSSLFGNRRVNKKLLRWALDIEAYGTRVTRKWIKGTDNTLGDAPSRNAEDRDLVRNLSVPGGPVKRIVRQMFAAPGADDEAMERYLECFDNEEPEKEKTGVGRPRGLVVEESGGVQLEESRQLRDIGPGSKASSGLEVASSSHAEGATGSSSMTGTADGTGAKTPPERTGPPAWVKESPGGQSWPDSLYHRSGDDLEMEEPDSEPTSAEKEIEDGEGEVDEAGHQVA